MSENPPNSEGPSKSSNVVWHHGEVDASARREVMRQTGCTLWFTGLSGSGKSTIAVETEQRLIAAGHACYRLDGDNVRHGLCGDLGFSADDRAENIRRVGEVARLFADAGVITLASFVSPYRADRDRVRTMHQEAGLTFLEVFVDTPLEVCETRDPKGLYKKARAGEIKQFTGIDDPYEAPAAAELRLATAELTVPEAAEEVLASLRERDLLVGS
ncbi:MAG: adenylyl-sulfate kinase [Planctomycetota bacterium]